MIFAGQKQLFFQMIYQICHALNLQKLIFINPKKSDLKKLNNSKVSYNKLISK